MVQLSICPFGEGEEGVKEKDDRQGHRQQDGEMKHRNQGENRQIHR